MFGLQFIAYGDVGEFLYLGIDIVDIGGKFPTQLAIDIDGCFPIFNNTHPSENDNAADIQRPFAVFSEAPVIYAKRNLIIGGYCIALVTFFAAFERPLFCGRFSLRVSEFVRCCG